MRRVALMLVAISVLGIGFTAGPAYAKSTKPAKITSCKKDKKLNANIQTAFATYFLGATTTDKMTNVQDGTKVAPFSDEATAAAKASGQGGTATTGTYPVTIKATCDGKTTATFTYDLALNVPLPIATPPSSGVGLNFAGDAALVKGKWLITGGTICDLVGANPATPTIGARCTAALG
jgi:hypothetical protein